MNTTNKTESKVIETPHTEQTTTTNTTTQGTSHKKPSHKKNLRLKLKSDLEPFMHAYG